MRKVDRRLIKHSGKNPVHYQKYLIRREESRTVVWFSCGAASAMCAWLLRDVPDTEFCYCDTSAYEHPDNTRFFDDIENLIGHKIKRLRHPVFNDIWHVFNAKGLRSGLHGAPCTYLLKRTVAELYTDPWDTSVFGYSAEEADRYERYKKNNPYKLIRCPLIEQNLTKRDCLIFLKNKGIELPTMYKLGYQCNNCIGCVKGGSGYWNKIRKDFPAEFARMARFERAIDFPLLRRKNRPCFLDELDPKWGRYKTEPDISCGPHCSLPLT